MADEEELYSDAPEIEPATTHANPAKGPHMEWNETARCYVGVDPRGMRAADMARLGIDGPRSPMAVIRAKCIDCCSGIVIEVRRCGDIKCPNWPFRMGSNPYRQPMSDERRAEASARFKAMHSAGSEPPAAPDDDDDEL